MSQNVLSRVDFPKLLEQIGFADVDPSATEYLGYCLFHEDVSTKSFSANLDKGLFHCFGCGVKGNAVQLYALWKHVDYAKAKEELSQLPVIRSVEKLQRQIKAQAVKVPTHRRLRILTEFVNSLPMVTATPLKSYLNDRCLSDKTLNDYGIRGMYLNTELAGELTKFSERYSVEELEAVGLATSKDGSYHRLLFVNHPIIFPFYLGKSVVYLQGRLSVDGTKNDLRYLGLGVPVTHAFNHNAIQSAQDTLYVCEGAMDALSMVELGYPSVIGIPGVENFKLEWINDFRCNQVVLAFDNDAAGALAYTTIAPMIAKRGISVRRIALPPEVKDINKFLISKKSADKVQN